MRGRRQASVTYYVTLVGARAGRPNGLSCGTVDHAQKIEPIVARLLDEDRLGGFHFNDGRYANDDFTLGSSDPHQVFGSFTRSTASPPTPAACRRAPP